MAIAETAHGNAVSNSTAAATENVTVTVAVGETVIVAVSTALSVTANAPTDNATGGSNTYVILATEEGTTFRMTLFGCLHSKSAVTTITCTFSSSRNGIAVTTYTGVGSFNQSNTNKATGSTSPATVTLGTGLQSGSVTVGGFANDGTGTWSASTGNLRNNIAGAGSTSPGVAIVDTIANGTTTVAAALSATTLWNAVAIEMTAQPFESDEYNGLLQNAPDYLVSVW